MILGFCVWAFCIEILIKLSSWLGHDFQAIFKMMTWIESSFCWLNFYLQVDHFTWIFKIMTWPKSSWWWLNFILQVDNLTWISNWWLHLNLKTDDLTFEGLTQLFSIWSFLSEYNIEYSLENLFKSTIKFLIKKFPKSFHKLFKT